MPHLTIREAALLIGRTPATVRRYIRSGRLSAEKTEGKFGEEYKIRREDLTALGFSESSVRDSEALQPKRPSPPPVHAGEVMVPISIYNELLMKHEQMLVQYGMIRAGGQKLLEFKVDAEAKAEDLRRAQDRYQALRVRAAKEIKFLRKHMRQAEIEIEERNIEITLLQEKVKRLERAAASVASVEDIESQVSGIRQKERDVARQEASDPQASTSYASPENWMDAFSPGKRGEDH
jgi:excisionase family DNA binding protein